MPRAHARLPFAVLMAFVAFVATMAGVGCGGGGGGSKPVAPGPPAGSISEVEPNDSLPQALGALGATDLVVSGSAASSGDVDLYSVTLAETTNVYMSLAWTGGSDLEVGLTDTSGILIHNQDSPTANPEQCVINARPPGTYRVRVGSHSSSATSYALTLGRR